MFAVSIMKIVELPNIRAMSEGCLISNIRGCVTFIVITLT